MNTYIQLIKSDSNGIYNITKDLKEPLFFWTFYSFKNCEEKYHSFNKNIKAAQLFSTLIIRRNVSLAPNQICWILRVISEGSCDGEDWSNGCYKFNFPIGGIHYILKHIQIENSPFKV